MKHFSLLQKNCELQP